MIANQNSPIEQKARLFWMARQTAADLIREGELERAGEMIPYLANAGQRLLAGNGVERVLGTAMRRSAEELFASLANAR